jgi:hypothetical protein
MSALGQGLPIQSSVAMAASPRRADLMADGPEVGFGPRGDIARSDALWSQVQSHFHTTLIALGSPNSARD